MEGPRAPLASEYDSVVRFLDDTLRSNYDWSISNEYPLALTPDNLSNIRIIREGDEILSHAVMKPLIVKSPAGLFKIAAIGSVVTATTHRNKGLSRSVLLDCLQSAQDQGCDFTILWTNLYDFYRKIGFETAGSEVALLIDKELDVPEHNLRFVESSKVAPESILQLYSQHTTGTMRTVRDIQRCLEIPNMRIFTAWDERNKLVAYAAEGKGADLGGYIHEWGGGVSKLIPLLAHVRQTLGQPTTVIAPWHSKNLIRQLVEHGATCNEGILGMIKILNPNIILQKVSRYARTIGVSDFKFDRRGRDYYFGTGENMFRTDSEQDVVRILFGPGKASQMAQFDDKTAETMDRIFPLPMWIWGWDSV